LPGIEASWQEVFNTESLSVPLAVPDAALDTAAGMMIIHAPWPEPYPHRSTIDL